MKKINFNIFEFCPNFFTTNSLYFVFTHTLFIRWLLDYDSFFFEMFVMCDSLSSGLWVANAVNSHLGYLRPSPSSASYNTSLHQFHGRSLFDASSLSEDWISRSLGDNQRRSERESYSEPSFLTPAEFAWLIKSLQLSFIVGAILQSRMQLSISSHTEG